MALQRTTTRKDRSSASATALDVAVIRCQGEMGELELAHLGEELFRLANRGCSRVVVDLSGVDHVNYRGLRPLAARARLWRGAGGDLKLAGLSAYLTAILRAAGVEEEFELHPDVESAKAAFVVAPVMSLVR